MSEPNIASTTLNYAEKGDTNGLYSLIHDHPHQFSQFLQDTDKLQFVHTPLHVAAAAGHTRFAAEMMNLMPSLGKKLDPDGLSPLHVALRENEIETAQALVRIDTQLVRVKGKDGFTPLLYAIERNAGLEVLAHFLMDCPDAIDDLNSRFQNAVHVAIEANNCQAIVLLLNWLVRRAREPVLGWRDEDGNTALHVAVKYNCVQGLKMMVRIAKLNKINSDGHTALDIAERFEDKTEMANVLKKAGAMRSKELPKKQTLSEYFISKVTILENLLRGYYFILKDLTNDMRSVVLVVAALIATAAYQAILQPPGGIYQGEADKTPDRATLEVAAALPPRPPPMIHFVGKMVMGMTDYNKFMPANTLAFTLSMVMIIFVLHGRPYNLILHTCLISLAYSYLIAMSFVSDPDSVSGSMFFMSWFVIAAAFVAKMWYYVVKALLVEDVWWLPRCGVMSSNAWYRVRQGHKIISCARNLKRQYKLIQR
ncbi:ankyrin repeat-containing protein at2g01680 [Phtheirospermum japonicum]|uniref:Ankyrin repeat-containing protein at2g01680 n=1 Tax=Phtheirospermum japonicum TaxID=374723 RepID=A0A830BSF9_9LAMI|nr:ankyrin repeat-containing protein at2g01680 [Phtheirospermum japonicum]